MKHTTAQVDAEVKPDRYYAMIRAQIEHEDNLTSQRVNWLVAAQSFLFTAYAITVSNSGPNHAETVIENMRLLMRMIPVTAIVMCVLIYTTIIAGSVAIVRLRKLYRDYADHEAMKGFPPIQGFRHTQILGQAGPLLVPILFLVVWIMLLVRGNTF